MALFGDGTADGSLIEKVHIGGGTGQNTYVNLRQVLTNLGISNSPVKHHQNHFHIYLKPPRRPVPIDESSENLLADTEEFSAMMGLSADNTLGNSRTDPFTDTEIEEELMLDVFVAALVSAVDSTTLPTGSGSPSVVAGQSNDYAKQFTNCQDVESQIPDSANNDFSPLRGIPAHNGIPIHRLNPKITVVEAPKHGTVNIVNAGSYRYNFTPDKDYVGEDRVVYKVDVGGKRYKVTLNFWIMPGIADPKGGAPYVPVCESKKFDRSATEPILIAGESDGTCRDEVPSLNIFEYMIPALSGGGINFSIADLPAASVGQTTGTTITLDTDAAGHGWFIDSTPGSNDEFLATSNPNIWVARPGSLADGKMDMLSVLLHEYGHALGLDHSEDSSDAMSAVLQPGVRKLWSQSDLARLVNASASALHASPFTLPDTASAPALAVFPPSALLRTGFPLPGNDIPHLAGFC